MFVNCSTLQSKTIHSGHICQNRILKSFALLLLLTTRFTAVNSFADCKATVLRLMKPRNTCQNDGPYSPKPSKFCLGDRLIKASTEIRRVYQAHYQKARANQNGEIILRLQPGYYELGLDERYSYTWFEVSFGIEACNFLDHVHSCPEQSGCYPVTLPSSQNQFPNKYRDANDYVLQNVEASHFFIIPHCGSHIEIQYGLRCL